MYKSVLSVSILFQMVAQVAATAHMMHSIIKMTIMALVIIFSKLDCFYLDATEFLIILVSCPVYVTTPTIHSVLRRLEPLSSKLSLDKDILLPSGCLITPSYL